MKLHTTPHYLDADCTPAYFWLVVRVTLRFIKLVVKLKKSCMRPLDWAMFDSSFGVVIAKDVIFCYGGTHTFQNR